MMAGHKRNANSDASTAKPVKLAKTSAVLTANDLCPEDVIARMSSPDLRKMMVSLLDDEIAGPIIQTSLLAPTNTEAVSAYQRAEAEKEYQKIISEARSAIDRVYDHALYMRGMESSDAWPGALQQFLPRIRALLNVDGDAWSGGAALAWKAALEVGKLCNLPPDGDVKLQEGEEECDWFHDRMDDLMVEICKMQQSHGQIEWLKDGRVKEVIALAKSPSEEIYMGKHSGKHPGDYRYKKVVHCLEQV